MVLALLRRADEVVVRDLELAPEVLEERRLGIAPLLRRHPVLGCCLGHLLAVLVHARQELHVVAGSPAEACLHIAEHRAVGSSQMRSGVHIVDGRGDEE